MNWYKIHKEANSKSAKILHFPQIRQADDYSCGASSLQGVLAYYGINVPENELQERLNTNTESGTDEEKVAAYAKKEGFHVDMRSMSIDDVINYINKGIPVILILQAWSEDDNKKYKESRENGHFVVAIGYSKNEIIFEDPSIIHMGFLTYQEIKERWHGNRSISKQMGIAIYGKEPVYNPKTVKPIE